MAEKELISMDGQILEGVKHTKYLEQTQMGHSHGLHQWYCKQDVGFSLEKPQTLPFFQITV